MLRRSMRRANEPMPPMMIMNSRFNERLILNANGSHVKVDKTPECTRDACVKRADREGGELGGQRSNPDHFGGDIHVRAAIHVQR